MRQVRRLRGSEWPQIRKRNHPRPSFPETTRVDGVKAPLHDGTPRSYREDKNDEARDGPKLLDVRRDLHAAFVPFGDVKEVNIPASRGAAVPSRHRRAASPGEDVVAGFFFDFEAVRTEYAPRRSTFRATSRARRTMPIEALPSSLLNLRMMRLRPCTTWTVASCSGASCG